MQRQNVRWRTKNRAAGCGRRSARRLCPSMGLYVYIYKDRAAPPIGGPALHDSGVKTVQRRKREGHDSYQEVEVYICM